MVVADLLARAVVRLSVAGDADQSEEFAEGEAREAKAHGHARSHENQFAKCGHVRTRRKVRARASWSISGNFGAIGRPRVPFRSVRLRFVRGCTTVAAVQLCMLH